MVVKNKSKDFCCSAWEVAQSTGTDNEGYGALLGKFKEGWRIGLFLPAICFCPWCGTQHGEFPSEMKVCRRSDGMLGTAIRWRKNGDHPLDNVIRPVENREIPPEPREGAIVRYFRHSDYAYDGVCPECGAAWYRHGSLNDLQNCSSIVCPGDWVVDMEDGQRNIFKHDKFMAEFRLLIC